MFVLDLASYCKAKILNKKIQNFNVKISDCKEVICEDFDVFDSIVDLTSKRTKNVEQGNGNIILGFYIKKIFKNNNLRVPKDKQEAFRMLRKLSGNTHTVFTGVSIIDKVNNVVKAFYEETRVFFKVLRDKDINRLLKIEGEVL